MTGEQTTIDGLVGMVLDPLTGEPPGDGSVELVLDDLGRAGFVPSSIAKLRGEQLLLAVDLQRTAIAVRDAQTVVAETVVDARDAGLSWAAIGWLVGTTGEAARQRYGGER